MLDLKMLALLEILRCVLCCADEIQDDDSEVSYGNTSWETRPLLMPSNSPPKSRVVFRSPPTHHSPDWTPTYNVTVPVARISTTSTTNIPKQCYDPPNSSTKTPQSFFPSSPSPSRPKTPTTSSTHLQTPCVHSIPPSKSSSLPFTASTSSIPKLSSKVPATPSSKQPPLAPKPQTSSSKPSLETASTSLNSSPSLPTFPSKPAASSGLPFPPPKAFPSTLGPTPFSPEPLATFKPTLSPAPSNLTCPQNKVNYIWFQKAASPTYAIPEHVKELINKDKVSKVLKKPLSPSTYEEYFAALLYAEDFYIEKWSEFNLKNVTLKLQEAEIFRRSSNGYKIKDKKTFVIFEIDPDCEKRPYLLSRDFVFARPSGTSIEPFQGFVYRVKKGTYVLAEFDEDFHSQHYSTRKYDVSFSFNRVCLKRAHQAVKAASDPSFKCFVFPDCANRKGIPVASPLSFSNNELDVHQASAVLEILRIRGAPPYLLEGPLCVPQGKFTLSRTGLVVKEAVLKLHRSSPKHRILLCAPSNITCDELIRGLKKEIPESDMFRANAAFREIDGVPTDILRSCQYEGECFTCPSLQELRKFRVILSTYVSTFRLRNEGITANHFSHIFLVDASSVPEPEAMVALANLANEKTAVIVTGARGNRSNWVRSDIARKHGLMVSYFERLKETKPYLGRDPMFMRELVDLERESVHGSSMDSFCYV